MQLSIANSFALEPSDQDTTALMNLESESIEQEISSRLCTCSIHNSNCQNVSIHVVYGTNNKQLSSSATATAEGERSFRNESTAAEATATTVRPIPPVDPPDFDIEDAALLSLFEDAYDHRALLFYSNDEYLLFHSFFFTLFLLFFAFFAFYHIVVDDFYFDSSCE